MKQTTENYEQYRPYLAQIFGETTDDQLKQVFSIAEVLHFEAGHYIFKEGDVENALYIVLSGRLRALHQTENGQKILGDIAAGEPVGELALFTKDPRSASVVAIRKSTVLQIDEADYNALVFLYPHFAFTLTQFVISRLKRNAFQQRMGAGPKNIAVVKLQSDHDFSAWTDDMSRELGIMGTNINVYYPDSQSPDNPNAVFDEMENNVGINVLVCDDTHQSWAKQCLLYCDLVIVATEFDAPKSLYPIEEHLNLYASNILNKKIYLLMLHLENAQLPTKTQDWFEGRNLDLHVHVRKNKEQDIRRFCRILLHQAIGLVLSGGGTKGYAHLGAAKALLEAGIEFDFVGGTSAGALYGLTMTYNDFNMDRVNAIAKASVAKKVMSNDYHFPFISLMSGKKIRNYLKELFEESYLEDVWINTFCISTNYSNSCLNIHSKGLARTQIEASVAIPGIFPPVVINNQLHLDGGVVDNLPIEAMYQLPVRHVIAISLVAQPERWVDLTEIPTAWQMFWNKITKTRKFGLPSLPTLLVNSMILNSRQKQELTKLQVALYLEINFGKFDFLDGNKWQEVIEKGYHQTQDYLKKLPPNEHFWKN